MNPDNIEITKTNPQWGKNYNEIMTTMDKQLADLRLLYRNMLNKRHELALMGLRLMDAQKSLLKVSTEIVQFMEEEGIE